MVTTNKYCIIIPVYNHGRLLKNVLEQLQKFNLDIIIVDDGCNAKDKQYLKEALALYKVYILTHEKNKGKGAAVSTAIEYAYIHNYTHAIQIDADGQHHIADIPRFIELSKQNPQYLISGKPIYDNSIPLSRKIGRYITHFWVWIETLSFSIKDSMCGFRVYPIAESHKIINKYKIGQYMDFDTDIMVRLYHNGTKSLFIDTKVTYPQDGISTFRAFKDNLLISKMHSKLVFSMLKLQLLKYFKISKQKLPWYQIQELKGAYGILILFKTYKIFGKQVFLLLLKIVLVFYYLSAISARTNSKIFLDLISAKRAKLGLAKLELKSFTHFQYFALSIMDKLGSWDGTLVLHKDVVFAPNAQEIMYQDDLGKLVLCSHLGDVEVLRALATTQKKDKIINALVMTKNAKNFNKVLKKIAPQSNINLIYVDEILPSTAIVLKEKIEQGQWVAIMADRVNSNYNDKNSVICKFLDKSIYIPKGPFILAAILKAPVLALFALKDEHKINIYAHNFAKLITLNRVQKDTAILHYAQQFADLLEYYSLRYPYNFYNFYSYFCDEKCINDQNI